MAASAPSLLNHVVQHGIAPIVGQVAQYGLTGAMPGAAAANPGAPRLGLSKDVPTAGNKKWYHFSGYITNVTDENGHAVNLDDPEDFSDARLAGIAAEAYRDMYTLLDSENAESNVRPAMMSALIAGGEIYLSSSIKWNGPGFRKLFPKSPVADALERCSPEKTPLGAKPELKEEGAMHRTGGNCGEPGALQLYYLKHPPKTPQDPAKFTLPNWSRIVTWERDRVAKPCGTPNVPNDRFDHVNGKMIRPPTKTEWGCERLTTELNVRAIYDDANTPTPARWHFTAVHVSF
jgi:hypothetical protein